MDISYDLLGKVCMLAIMSRPCGIAKSPYWRSNYDSFRPPVELRKVLPDWRRVGGGRADNLEDLTGTGNWLFHALSELVELPRRCASLVGRDSRREFLLFELLAGCPLMVFLMLYNKASALRL